AFQNLSERVMVQDIQQVRDVANHLVPGFDGRARAFVQVQNGCDHRCTFCIIPFGRGPSRSVPVGSIVQQVAQLVADGYNEIVLTGVDLTSYGHDLPGQPRLGQMVRRLLALVPQLPRLRLSSLDPAEIDDDLWHAFEHDRRLMPHLHLSLQAGDDMVLKRMKRRHTRQQALDVCARAKAVRPDVVLGADIIAGFPTETDEMFQKTCQFIEEAGLVWLHVFPYSARQGTPAARMPQVPVPVRKERAAALRAMGEQQQKNYLQSLVRQRVAVVVEQSHTARTPGYATVHLSEVAPTGSVQNVLITHWADGKIFGDVVQDKTCSAS
ncbi:MAG: MiaB/RimO family radical SAM methylthiotransferase, partial [Alphaproteobacteria bacterium]|nr:MiaB/RimO family radical SAM methylthiotransferase [Alphaproteobacteria bacterium]